MQLSSAITKQLSGWTNKSKRRKHAKQPVPTLRSNLSRTWGIMRKHRDQLLKVLGIYALLYFFFVRAITNVNLEELRSTISLVFGDGTESLSTRFALAGALFGESTNFDQSTGFYFSMIFLINSLALIWLLKHYWARRKTTVAEAYYQGMYPLVPIIILVGVIVLQSIPFSIGSYIMQVAFDNSLAVNFIERVGVVGVFFLGLTISGYWIIGSIMAIYAVTVPGMTPLAGLREAKLMLKGRRFLVLKQVTIFILLTAILCMALLLGIVYVLPDAAILAVTAIVVLLMPWSHLYLYGLYRDLVDE